MTFSVTAFFVDIEKNLETRTDAIARECQADRIPGKSMKLLQIEPYTPEWHDWRSGRDLPDGPRITETAAAIIAGHSRGASVHRLWQEQTGRVAPREPQDNTAARSSAERRMWLREFFTSTHGLSIKPACIESSEHTWIGATLDGLSERMNEICMLVTLSSGEHDSVRNGQVPMRLLTRMQWQLLCAGSQVRKGLLFACRFEASGIQPGVMVEMIPDEDKQFDLLESARRFREAVVDNVPPAGSRFEQAAHQWLLAHRQVERASQQLEVARARLAVLYPAGVDPITAGGVTVYRTNKSNASGPSDLQSLVVKRASDAPAVLEQLDALDVPLADLREGVTGQDVVPDTPIQLGW